MAFTSYADFADLLASMTVAGVANNLDEPPSIETSGNFPIMFPRLPSVEREVVTLGSEMGLKTATCELEILVARDTINTPAVRFSTAIALIDALDAALETNAETIGIDSWTIQPEVTDTDWAIVATVEGSA